MEPIPEEWIDKLFNCLSEWYGERWETQFKGELEKSLHKTIWKNALHGTNYEQIKGALVLCKRHAQIRGNKPPHALEFWRYATGQSVPHIDYDRELREKKMETYKKLGEIVK